MKLACLRPIRGAVGQEGVSGKGRGQGDREGRQQRDECEG